ncbi:uncharacterized protein [Cicer arietinum]|uniref:Transcription termination factor MTERF15, mitochondrial-like n=1 Tax=Cicer arietinum TaxID=3827 RepID=A0A1S2Z8U0_CICAR|nr:transcription termination factor MTERF15, mitochondrial-like [Cicer arietinum]
MHHFLITRFTHRTLNSSVLSHNAFSLFFNYRYFSVSNTNHHHKDENFTLSSFVKSCGLSPEATLKLSKRLQIKNPNSPNAVIQLLKTYGFSDSQLRSVVKKLPFLLLSNAEKTLLPKLKFFDSIGVSSTDLPKILIGNCAFLSTSLKNNLIPRYEITRSLVRNDDEVVSVMKHWSRNFYNNSMLNDSIPNIEVLRKLGLPQSSISLLVSNFPNVAFGNHSKFVESVNTVKEMGFDPLKTYFVLALQVIAKMDKETWESKLKLFEKFGWSRDICLSAHSKSILSI